MTTLPAPLPATPIDHLIILAIDEDGRADTTIAHLPATVRTYNRTGGERRRWDEMEEPPVRWESACGDVVGWVYNRGGSLANIEICAGCEIAGG